jgi:hypothetical protein
MPISIILTCQTTLRFEYDSIDQLRDWLDCPADAPDSEVLDAASSKLEDALSDDILTCVDECADWNVVNVRSSVESK